MPEWIKVLFIFLGIAGFINAYFYYVSMINAPTENANANDKLDVVNLGKDLIKG
jgi:cytoskeletal protein RodZ